MPRYTTGFSSVYTLTLLPHSLSQPIRCPLCTFNGRSIGVVKGQGWPRPPPRAAPGDSGRKGSERAGRWPWKRRAENGAGWVEEPGRRRPGDSGSPRRLPMEARGRALCSTELRRSLQRKGEKGRPAGQATAPAASLLRLSRALPNRFQLVFRTCSQSPFPPRPPLACSPHKKKKKKKEPREAA